MPVVSMRNVTLQIQDGTSPTPNFIDVKLRDGDLSWTEKRNLEYIFDRGIVDSVRQGDDVPVEIKFSAFFEFITYHSGDTGVNGTITVMDALKQLNNASSWVSSDADSCAPYALDLVFLNLPICAGVSDEKALFADFRYESADFNPKAGSIALSGKCNIVQPTVTRGSYVS